MSKVYFETQWPSDNVTENRVEIGQVSALFQLKYCLGGVYSPPFTAYVVFFPFTGQRLNTAAGDNGFELLEASEDESNEQSEQSEAEHSE